MGMTWVYGAWRIFGKTGKRNPKADRRLQKIDGLLRMETPLMRFRSASDDAYSTIQE